MWTDFLIQSIGIFGAIFAFIAFQCKVHYKIMIFKVCASLCFVLQFSLMKAYTGVAMNAFGIAVFIINAVIVAKNRNPLLFVILSSILCVVIGVVSWVSYASILAIVGELIVTVSCGIKKLKYLRFVYFFGSVCWLIYDVIFFTLGGIVTEVFSITSIIIATIVMLKNDRQTTKQKNE